MLSSLPTALETFDSIRLNESAKLSVYPQLLHMLLVEFFLLFETNLWRGKITNPSIPQLGHSKTIFTSKTPCFSQCEGIRVALQFWDCSEVFIALIDHGRLRT
ncbi:hypothetical protein EMIT0215P_50165 [Pseudomonas serboccidentalis]